MAGVDPEPLYADVRRVNRAEPAAPGRPPNNPLLGGLWMLGAVASFAAMQISGRELSANHDAFAILFYRSAAGVLLILPIALAFGGLKNIVTRRPFGHLVRNIVHFGGQFGWFYGIAHLAMADVTALASTTPIFGVLLALAFLGERLTWPRALVIAAGFAGVLLVVRPGFIPIEAAAGVTVMGAFCYAVSIVMVKALTATEPPLRIVFIMMALQSLMALALTLAVSGAGAIATPTAQEWPAVIVVGMGGLTAHYCMAKAVSVADASVVMPVNFLQLPAMAIAGLLLYREAVDPFTLLGGGLILAATYLNVLWSRRRGR